MKKTKMKIAAFVVAAAMATTMVPATLFASAAPDVSTTIVNMKTDGLVNPLGIDDTVPEFSWQMDSNVIGAKQESYHIVVKDKKGAVVWDSGIVKDSKSTFIKYAGDALDTKSTYTWTVTVTDENGKTYTSDPAIFETGLMSTSQDAWGGAEWIGADELTFDATSACYFDLGTTITIPEGNTKASLILGANDFRLNNEYFNIWRDGGENYFKYEIDITDPNAAKLNIYVVGMPAMLPVFDENGDPVMEDGWGGPTQKMEAQEVENDPSVPDITIDISKVINAENAHQPITISVDTASQESSKVTCTINGTVVDNGRQLNPLGAGGNYNSFPNVNSVGFAVPAGETATYSNFEIRNPGPYSTGMLFDATTGATYDIFKGLDGVTVNDDNTITVGKKDADVLAYADPSYGSAPMLRTEFNADKEIASARMYVTAAGIYEMYINGERMGDDWFNPGNTEYREEMAYHTYDVTDMLKQGENAIGAKLGEGWWSGYMSFTASNYNYYGDKQALMAKLEVTYADGSTETIVTDDATWDYYGDGPVEYGSFFQGERYDATKEAAIEGWDEAGYDDSQWRDAEVIPFRAQFDDFDMVTRYDEPAGIVNEIPVQEALGESRPGSGSYIYDMGENVIGVPQITIPEGYVEEGQEVTIRYAEILYPDNLEEYTSADIDGLLMTENYRAAMSTDFYTAKAGENVIEPHFTFHGYRYLEITGLKKELPADCIKTLIISSVDTTATYDSSNALSNRLFKNVQNSQTSNFLSLPTDCPQRNERMGWTGDAQVFSRAASYNADVYNFYRQWLNSLRAEQGEAGDLPVYAPAFGSYDLEDTSSEVGTGNPGGFNGVSWDAALTLVPWQMYRQYGNPSIIEDNIDAIYKYLNYLDNNDMTYTNEDGEQVTEPSLTSKTGFLADWLSRVSTDAALINNGVYIYLMDVASQMAEVVGRTDMAAELRTRYDAAKEAWNRIYVDPETGKTKTPNGKIQDTEASYATALVYNVFNEANKEKAAENYLNTVKNPDQSFVDDNGNIKPYTITSGFSGTPNLVPALTQNGYIDDAYKLFESTDYASWLYPVTQGATSVWERWNSYTVENGFGGNNSMNSFNHFSLGAISEWMMGYQLGITGDDANPGYQEFILQPTVGGSFTYANGSFESNYGEIYSGWTADNGTMTSYEAVVPANTTATLYLPVSEEAVAEFENIAGVTYEGMTINNETTVAKFTVEAGGYNFALQDGKLVASIADGYVADETETADKGILNFVIEYADAAKASGEYDNAIESVQKSFDEALTNAKAVTENDAATQEEVDAAWKTLLNEIHKLGFVAGDKTELASLIAAAEGIDLSKYVEAGQAEFTAALEAAQSVYKDGDAMQAEINEVADNLLNAMLNLRYKADKSILEEVVAKANQIDANAYTAESYAVLEAALKDADAVLANENATQEEVDVAVQSVQTAMDSLVAVEGTETETPTTDNNATQTGQESTTTKTNAAKTGDIAPIAGIAVLAVAGAAILITRKKK
ncbi:family 78 glycoside hydrolase catalytic domain [Clostridium facile]|uniref:alpha-L-rhamnosidase n=1 Tax=Clostridium facile TaxID=2763035 RepID=A0ABR7ISZ4_9CLOT|nr:family 78 glycoside hydrolase catalytic domain [Clostridium facile]MBC5788144.1 family 78 glycoside hydrolase catalytic domain [Clostridium facile]